MSLAERHFPRDISCLGEIFAFVAERLTHWRVDQRTSYCVNLAVEEIFTNLVKYNHGTARKIKIAINRDGDEIQVDLIDVGVEPFDSGSVPAPRIDAGIGDRKAGGLGLHLVRSLVDSLHYDYEAETRTMRVSVSKQLES